MFIITNISLKICFILMILSCCPQMKMTIWWFPWCYGASLMSY